MTIRIPHWAGWTLRQKTRRWVAVVGGALVVVGVLVAILAEGWSLDARVLIGVLMVIVGLSVIVISIPGAVPYVAAAGWAWAIVLIWVLSWAMVWIDRVNTRIDFVDEPSAIALSLGAIAIILFAAVYLRGRLPSAPSNREADGDDAEGGGDRIRAAIATTFIVVFLLLVIDLLTIPGFRGSLSDVADVAVTATGTEASSTGVNEPCPTSSPSPPIEPGVGEPAATESPSPTPECAATAAVAVSFVEGLFGVFKWAITAIIIFYFGGAAVAKVAQEKTKRAEFGVGSPSIQATTGDPAPSPARAEPIPPRDQEPPS